MDYLSNPFFWLSMTIIVEALIICVAALGAGINDQNVSIPFMMFSVEDKPMNAKDKLHDFIADEFRLSSEITRKFVDCIIEAVKEDIKGNPQFDHTWEGTYEIPHTKPCPNCDRDKIGKLILVDHIGTNAKCVKCGKKVPYPQNPHAEPETTLDIIQGYTENEWEDISEGKYWCEFSLVPFESNGHKIIGKLSSYGTAGFFMTGDGQRWSSCRPAQSKGIMRPIFVEPVDKAARCIFCDKSGDVRVEILWADLPTFGQHEPDQLDKITKYIEL